MEKCDLCVKKMRYVKGKYNRRDTLIRYVRYYYRKGLLVEHISQKCGIAPHTVRSIINKELKDEKKESNSNGGRGRI